MGAVTQPGPGAPAQALALGGAAYVDDRLDEARALWEQAFRGFVASGEQRPAARVATLLGELHWGGLGNPSIGRGWLQRARRLLTDCGPCPELGYWELARLACDRPNILELQTCATRALDLAVSCGDIGLHTRALADSGFALVCTGQLNKGFARLEEALATLSAGEIGDPFVVSTTCCALLSACERAGDLDRATEWLRVVGELVLGPARGRPRMLAAHCELARSGVLLVAGRLDEAEACVRAIARNSGATANQRADAAARLAALCVQSGRLDEADAVLSGIEDQPAAAFPAALLRLARGEPKAAVTLLSHALDEIPGDVLRSCVLLSLLMETAVTVQDTRTSILAQTRLRLLRRSSSAPLVIGTCAYAEAAQAAARGDRAAAQAELQTARAQFTAAGQSWHLARTHLAFATLLADSDPEEARTAARAGHAVAARCRFDPIRDACAALLRRLGAKPPRATTATLVQGLTGRETDVLRAVRRGNSNAEIAAALYLSPKTVEHHVSRILTKLGARTRAEAAALAATADLTPEP